MLGITITPPTNKGVSCVLGVISVLEISEIAPIYFVSRHSILRSTFDGTYLAARLASGTTFASEAPMKLAITGRGPLAATTRLCCAPHFELVDLPAASVVWSCHETPLDASNQPLTDRVLAEISADLIHTRIDAYTVVSSPWPVGSTAALELDYPYRRFAYVPENIRLATGPADFTTQARIIVGRRSRHAHWDSQLDGLLRPFTNRLIWTTPETAEMCKHALNGYLGMMIAYANELGRLCAAVGADMSTVTEALLSEPRVSPTAPLRAGKPFGGGHLARDINGLNALARNISVPIVSAILESNRVS